MRKNSKLYIAGHTGLLGSALLQRLRLAGYRNIITRSHAGLDLTDQKRVSGFFAKEHPEYVFLCAGLTGGIIANRTSPADFLHTNIAIQDNVFQAAQKYDIKHLVFYGSSCSYPKDCPQPIKEEYLYKGEIESTSEAYAIAKTAGVIACRSYNAQFKTNKFITLLPNSMYGPNDNFDLENSHVLAALIRKFYEAKNVGQEKIVLWGSGKPRREFVFAGDVADASIFAMNNADRLNSTQHYNVGSGIDCSIKELAGQIANLVGFKGKIEWDTAKPDGTPQKLLDSSRFQKLGWSATISLKKGLDITYRWFVDNFKKRH
ncbi:MAG TPA: GDP-fucose synthetase [Elusimicrobia bacterium]|nr:GDP-fucose synthetase [Elusimicrobiota bacterium]